MPLPKIGSMDGNTGRSEGATAEKAVPFPCAVLDPNRSFVELRVGEPRPGARSVSSPPEVLKPIRRQLGIPANGFGDFIRTEEDWFLEAVDVDDRRIEYVTSKDCRRSLS
jgi:hypothetical protein